MARVPTFSALVSPPMSWRTNRPSPSCVQLGCSPNIVVLIAMSIPIRDRDVFIDDIKPSFGSYFILMPREQAGVVIGSSTVSDSFLGFTYSLVAKVLSIMMALSKLICNYRMTGLSDDDVRSLVPPPLVSSASELGVLLMDIPLKEKKGRGKSKSEEEGSQIASVNISVKRKITRDMSTNSDVIVHVVDSAGNNIFFSCTRSERLRRLVL
ncbi:Hypothetical predicted protein [Prunus dulcis]|uniref:Uncharacterized protein n=1 Tax=Prunus dulcis TaxID=3755 RepID=A0A5E4GEL0_PRUDU|nr:Hypothetical predicted protein [Prunus dulcis]